MKNIALPCPAVRRLAIATIIVLTSVAGANGIAVTPDGRFVLTADAEQGEGPAVAIRCNLAVAEVLERSERGLRALCRHEGLGGGLAGSSALVARQSDPCSRARAHSRRASSLQ